jgi:hypothetical protein
MNWIPGKDVVLQRTGALHDRPSHAPGGSEFPYSGGPPRTIFSNSWIPTPVEELKAKTVITSTVYDDRIDYLKDKGVDVIIDTTPRLLKTRVGVSVLEAMLHGRLRYPQGDESDDELLEIISNMQMDPVSSILREHPSGSIGSPMSSIRPARNI